MNTHVMWNVLGNSKEPYFLFDIIDIVQRDYKDINTMIFFNIFIYIIDIITKR